MLTANKGWYKNQWPVIWHAGFCSVRRYSYWVSLLLSSVFKCQAYQAMHSLDIGAQWGGVVRIYSDQVLHPGCFLEAGNRVLSSVYLHLHARLGWHFRKGWKVEIRVDHLLDLGNSFRNRYRLFNLISLCSKRTAMAIRILPVVRAPDPSCVNIRIHPFSVFWTW